MSDAEKRVVIPLGEQSKAQVLSRLAANPGFISLDGEPSVYLTWRRTQCLSRLAAAQDPSIYLAWRRTQHLSRLAANPGFILLGGESSVYLA